MSNESIRNKGVHIDANSSYFDESLDLTDESADEGRESADEDEEEEDHQFQGKMSRDTSNNPPRGDTPPSQMSESEGDYVEGDDDEDDMSASHDSIASERIRAKSINAHQALSASDNAIHQRTPKESMGALAKSKSDNAVRKDPRVEMDRDLKRDSVKHGHMTDEDTADPDLITGDESHEEDEDELSGAAYGAKEMNFKDSSLSDEMKEIFQYIARYHPQEIELEPQLQPFIPEFIPAIGDIDAFIKISRPDQKPEALGLSVLDEPSGKQSDPTVLDLHLRAVTKSIAPVPQVVRSIDSISLRSNTKPLDNWIRNVKELHAAKPAPSVHYSRRMPDIEELMQVWPVEIEEALATIKLPTADLEISLASFSRLLTAILDIPTPSPQQQQQQQQKEGTKRKQSTSTIESLHVLFTLYSEFKNSQHFRSFGRTAVERDVEGAQ
ncbi:Intraflagellar transport protein 46 [Podochytrium sp. JEL0797]|nr:Intraflagellar transport protein 46 [Podochytrium sp. JEL0797]